MLTLNMLGSGPAKANQTLEVFGSIVMNLLIKPKRPLLKDCR